MYFGGGSVGSESLKQCGHCLAAHGILAEGCCRLQVSSTKDYVVQLRAVDLKQAQEPLVLLIVSRFLLENT